MFCYADGIERSEAYITSADAFGDDCPDSWEYAMEYLNGKTDELEADMYGRISKSDVEEIWETYCRGGYDIDMAEHATNEQLAQMIRDKDVWDMDLLRILCGRAGMLEEWDASDGDTFETVAVAAAEKLGVEIVWEEEDAIKLWEVRVNRLGWDSPKTLYATSRKAAEELAAAFPAHDNIRYAGQFGRERALELTEIIQMLLTMR